MKTANKERKQKKEDLITYSSIQFGSKKVDLAFDLTAFDLFTSRVKGYNLGSQLTTGHYSAAISAGIDVYCLLHEKQPIKFIDVHMNVLKLAETPKGQSELNRVITDFANSKAMKDNLKVMEYLTEAISKDSK
jgi:hypothetical protein